MASLLKKLLTAAGSVIAKAGIAFECTIQSISALITPDAQIQCSVTSIPTLSILRLQPKCSVTSVSSLPTPDSQVQCSVGSVPSLAGDWE